MAIFISVKGRHALKNRGGQTLVVRPLKKNFYACLPKATKEIEAYTSAKVHNYHVDPVSRSIFIFWASSIFKESGFKHSGRSGTVHINVELCSGRGIE